MKFIQQINFSGETVNAIEKYKQAFGCTVKTLIYYSDAVQYGWEQPDKQKDSLVYHSEIMFGNQEVRMNDLSDKSEVELTKKVVHIVGFDTEDEVKKAFSVLSEGGEVIRPLEKPPFMVIIGTVRDCFGVQWTLMCDY